ncbi:MAG TPA: YceI family protein [Acidobacteriaceae bacterium]|jgi:polyisoprenoid-binding protein YceI|nr:YceI family protein [Acidobacteriaceae bacterium]
MKLARFVSAGVTFTLLAVAAPALLAQSATWKSDPAHSEVDFSIVHLGITAVRGRMGAVNATLTTNGDDLSTASVKATIDVTGIDTGVSARDNDLKSARFFDTGKYPSATFTSTSVTKGGSGLTVQGNLTLKGVTKPVTLDVTGPAGPVTGMGNKTHEGFEATTTIHRTDFGIATGMPTAMVGDDVKLTIDLDFAKQ